MSIARFASTLPFRFLSNLSLVQSSGIYSFAAFVKRNDAGSRSRQIITLISACILEIRVADYFDGRSKPLLEGL